MALEINEVKKDTRLIAILLKVSIFAIPVVKFDFQTIILPHTALNLSNS